MVGHQTLNLAIGVRVPASQPIFPNRQFLKKILRRRRTIPFINVSDLNPPGLLGSCV
jgi:hypothetical protein